MTVRTTKKTVTFANSFVLGDFDEVLPPGTYDVETDEELLKGLSFYAYRRVLTLIRLPAKTGQQGLSRVLTVDPDELDAALKRDEASIAATAGRSGPKTREAAADGHAVDRAEDEGMTAPSG